VKRAPHLRPLSRDHHHALVLARRAPFRSLERRSGESGADTMLPRKKEKRGDGPERM